MYCIVNRKVSSRTVQHPGTSTRSTLFRRSPARTGQTSMVDHTRPLRNCRDHSDSDVEVANCLLLYTALSAWSRSP